MVWDVHPRSPDPDLFPSRIQDPDQQHCKLPTVPTFSGGTGNAWGDTGARSRNGVNSASLSGYGQQAGFGRGDTADNSNSSRQQQEEWNRRFSKQGGWEAVQSATQAVSRLAYKFLCQFGAGYK
jgi:hypothetical protein